MTIMVDYKSNSRAISWKNCTIAANKILVKPNEWEFTAGELNTNSSLPLFPNSRYLTPDTGLDKIYTSYVHGEFTGDKTLAGNYNIQKCKNWTGSSVELPWEAKWKKDLSQKKK